MIRPKIKEMILSTLGKGYFEVQDFDIQYLPQKKDLSSRVEIKIQYQYDPQYFIQLSLPYEKSSTTRQENFLSAIRNVEHKVYKIQAIMCPGELMNQEKTEYEGVEGLAQAIAFWQKNLWQDLMAAPQMRLLNQHSEEIERLKNQIQDTPNEYFTVEEGERLKIRLDQVKEQITSHYNTQEKEIKEIKEQLNQLHQEFETLKKMIYSLDKGKWYKSAFTKLMNWSSKKENQERLIKAGWKVGEYLLDQIKA